MLICHSQVPSTLVGTISDRFDATERLPALRAFPVGTPNAKCYYTFRPRLSFRRTLDLFNDPFAIWLLVLVKYLEKQGSL